MTLGKITIDGNVKYIPQSEQTREIKPNMIKNSSLPKNENQNISQNNKKIFSLISGEGFKIIKR